jgi:hypothetical protein
MLGVAGVLALGDTAMAVQSPPGRDMAVDDPAWRLLDANEELAPCTASAAACTDGEVRAACNALEDALHPTAGPGFLHGARREAPDPSKVPEVDVPKLVAFCHARAPKI